MTKLTTEEFIEKSNTIHNFRYDYSISKYTSGKNKITIICNEHGEFSQRASAHLEGQGCMGCRLENRRTGLELFLERCFEIHGDKYDYSLIDKYTNNRDKVKVICKYHGVFEITPEHHTNRKQGCSECKKMGLEKFLISANKKHNNTYDYSLITEYKNNKEKVKIICKKHGVFEQRVIDHISGIGCSECTQNRFRLSTQDFINKANILHNNKYEYSSTIDFKSNKDKVEIICKEHGKFLQRVNSHLTGQGCPTCKESKGEEFIRNYLIDNKIGFIQEKKFKDCIYKSELPFDFYLPELNTCIEYNGIQHYKPIEYFGGLESFEYQIIRDKIKNEYCLNNNIHLLIIKYNDNILEKLSTLLDIHHFLKQD